MRNNAYLLWQLTKKDIEMRYKGSVLGILWSLLTPLLMLVIYTIVFSEVFQVKWGNGMDNKFAFALTLFSGLNVINMMTEVLNRSTTLIAGHVNYVKKIIFPLEILPLMLTFSGFFNCLIGYLILLLANLVLTHAISPTLWLFPVAIVPVVLISIGIGYIVSGISVFLKDMINFIAIVSVLLMYTSPVFFPLEAVPERFAIILKLNPLTYVIENMRNITLYGNVVDWSFWFISITVGCLLSVIGYKIFQLLKKGFADVL
jgi:lipopolysaccharide transport system permease protein